MEELRIYLFGGFLLERAGVALPPIASRTGRSLFAHLVMNRDRPLQRDLLAGVFWPELPEGRARRRLSHTLWQIQDVVNEDHSSHLAVTSDTLAFDTSSPYWLDVEEFDLLFESSKLTGGVSGADTGRLDAASLRSCVELYRGDFMAGFFDDWVVVDQDHYRQRYLVALSRLVDATKASGAYEEALSYARRLTHHDPLSEENHQEVMRLCFLLGRTGEAVEQFDRCRSVLADELESEPSPATIDLYNKIVRQRRAGIRPMHDETPVLMSSRPEAPFVGREQERRSLVDHMERVLAGPGGVVLLEGEPGVGKTRLARESTDDARWRGFEVSWGSCAPGALRPFAPLVQILDGLSPLRVEQLSEQVPPVWLGETVRLAPELASRAGSPAASTPLRPAEESSRMREALVHTLGALGEITPHLVVIDDVQWADRDTLSVINQLARRLTSSRILLLLLYRSEEARGDPEVWDMLRDGDRVAGLGRVVLSPLSVFELEEMVKKTLGLSRLEPSVATQLHRQTGGNALFGLETLLALRDRGLFETGDAAEVLQRQLGESDMPVAPRVRSVIDARMSLLRDDTAAVFELAAVCGQTVDLGVLAGAADLARGVVLESVDELAHRGLVHDDGDGRYRIAHDQVRQVAYDRIEPARRAALHRRVAETMDSGRSDDVEAIGYHFWQGQVPHLAASHLREAGRRAMRVNAFATAEQHLQTARLAAAEAGWPARDRYELLSRLEDVLNVLGRREAQREVIEEMGSLAASDPVITAGGEIERRMAWLLAHTADFAGAERSAASAVELERNDGESGRLAASLIALGTCVRWSGRPLEAVAHLEEAVEVSEQRGRQRADALTELGSTLVEVQRFDEAMSCLAEAQRVYERSEDLRGQAEVAGIQGRASHQRGDRSAAEAQLERAIELCRLIGYRHGQGVNLVNLSLLHHMLGQVADALPGYDAASKIFADLGNRRGEAMVLANSASARQSLLGDYERAEADARRAMRIFLDMGDRAREAQCLEIIAGVKAGQGDLDEAERLLEESLSSLNGTGNRFLELQHLRSLVRLQIERGEHAMALGTLDRADRLASDSGLDDLGVELASIRGMALLAGGDAAAAVELTEWAAGAITPGVERPYLVHHRHALAALAAGRHDQARRAALLANEGMQRALGGLSSEEHDKAIRLVADHRHIVEAAARLSPRTVETLLPAVDAPTGRPLGQDDLRRVSWTVDHPEDGSLGSAVERRRARVLRLLLEAGERGACPSIDDLASALEVSGSTIRRDLDALRAAGHPVATRGQRQAS